MTQSIASCMHMKAADSLSDQSLLPDKLSPGDPCNGAYNRVRIKREEADHRANDTACFNDIDSEVNC